MPDDHLRVLMSVVDGGSIGKAAKRLATSQRAVSRAIAERGLPLSVRACGGPSVVRD
jgi:DNA-binding transcriptional LysR family regulator